MFENKKTDDEKAAAEKAEHDKASRGTRGAELVPHQAAPREGVPDQGKAEATQKVQARTLTGMPRNRAGQGVQADWTELDVTQQQLAELQADDQIQVRTPGQRGAERDEEPRNVMHAAFDPALAAMHPDRLKALAEAGGGQLPPASYQTTQGGNPNAQPAGSQAGLGGLFGAGGAGAREEIAGEQAGAEMAARRGQSKPPPKNT